MKLNFYYCKNCPSVLKGFENTLQRFHFYCDDCGYFELMEEEYDNERFDYKDDFEYHMVEIQDITDEEWRDINQMNVVDCDKERFDRCCHCRFEHIVDNQP